LFSRVALHSTCCRSKTKQSGRKHVLAHLISWAHIENIEINLNDLFAALGDHDLQSAIVCLITGNHPHEAAWSSY